MALPEYQRTILRQVQDADMSSANVWKTLANTLDNYSSQLTGVANTQMSNFKSNQASSRAAAKSAENSLRLSNERATKVYVDGKESDVLTSLSQLSIDFANDYTGYIKAANNLQKTWLESPELDGVDGMRDAFTTMVTNKIQQYGVEPYKNYALKEKENGKRVGTQNLDDFVVDANFQISQFIDSVNDGSIEQLDNLDNYQQQTDIVEGKYLTLTAKIDDLVRINNFSADEAIALEDKMTLQFFSGIIKSQLDGEMKNNNGWNAIEEFHDSPNKFIRKRAHLNALLPKGIKINDEMAASIYSDLLSYYKESNTQRDYLQTKVEEEDTKRHSDNFSGILQGFVEGSTSYTKEFLMDMLKSNDLSNDGHDTLLKAIFNETYVKDDAMVVWGLNKLLVNPESNFQEREASITEALIDGDISVPTASAMLTKIVDSDKVTEKPYFSIGWRAIENGLVDDVTKLTDNEGDVLNFAQQEYYNRVQGYTDGKGEYHAPENAQDIYQEIVEKYRAVLKTKYDDDSPTEVLDYGKTIDITIGADLAAMSYDKTTGWNTFFIGTPAKPESVQTKIKIGTMLEADEISEKDAEILLKQLKGFMTTFLKLN